MKNNSFFVIENLKENQQFIVRDSEEKTFFIFLTDGNDQIGDVMVKINGKNAKVQIFGIILGFGNQNITLYTLQNHTKEGGVSDLFIKSILFDKARLTYEGLIKIEKGAHKSDAFQKNQNLLMSPNAWAKSNPYLEILANSVRCTHAATVGKINNNQLYYLQSRGLPRKEAEQLLIAGFLEDIILRISDADIQEKIRKEINIKLKKLMA